MYGVFKKDKLTGEEVNIYTNADLHTCIVFKETMEQLDRDNWYTFIIKEKMPVMGWSI